MSDNEKLAFPNLTDETMVYTDEDAAAGAKAETLPDGVYLLKVVEPPERSVSTSKDSFGNMQLSFKLSPMRNPEDFNSVVKNYTIRKFLTLPYANPDIAGHVKPAWAMRQWHPMLAAIYADVIPRPERVSKGVYQFEGRTIRSGEYEAALQKGLASCSRHVKEVIQDPTIALKWAIYARVETAPSKKDPTKSFTNLVEVYHTLPAGVSLMDF